MKKEQEKKEEYQIVLSKLTGQVGVDKKFLIDSIHSLRNNKKNYSADIAVLGTALYSILIENGLNESDTINEDRLLDKANAYVYEGKYDLAIEILEVLDSLQPSAKFDEKGKKVYNFINPIESMLMVKKGKFKSAEDVKFIISARSSYMFLKATIYEEKGDKESMKKVINELLDFNPVYFDALIVKAVNENKKGSEKLKKALLEVYEYAYEPTQVIKYLQEMSKYFFDKKDYLTAISCLIAVTLYNSYSLVESDIANIEKEANKTSITKFNIPTSDEVKRILQRLEIPRMVKEQNTLMVESCYYTCLKEEKPNEDLMKYCQNIIIQTFGNDDIIKELEAKAKGDKKR